jgi:hypothetical protein
MILTPEALAFNVSQEDGPGRTARKAGQVGSGTGEDGDAPVEFIGFRISQRESIGLNG